MNGFRFIHFNMMVKVEKLVGHGTDTGGGIAKVDKWELLTESDLTSNDDALFCRMTYFDSKLLGGFELPIVDQYFILGIPSSPLLGSIVSLDLDPAIQNAAYFDSLNEDGLKAIKGILDKGKQKIKLAKEIVPSALLAGTTGLDMTSDAPTTIGSVIGSDIDSGGTGGGGSGGGGSSGGGGY
jgi:hypothetical protein